MKGGSTAMSKRTKAVLSVLAVASLVFSSFIFLTDLDSPVSADTATVTISYYNDGATTDGGVTTAQNGSKYVNISYEGIASTEYNPEYWADSGKVPDDVGNWTGPTNSNAPYDFKVSLGVKATASNITYYISSPSGYTLKSVSCGDNVVTVEKVSDTCFSYSCKNTNQHTVAVILTGTTSVTKVFGGWNTGSNGSGTNYLPGDVVPSTATTLYANWITPDFFTADVSATAITASSTSSGSPQAMVLTGSPDPQPYFKPTINGSYVIQFNYTGITQTHSDNRTVDNMFGTIFKLDKPNVNSGKIVFNATIKSGTYRSTDLNNLTTVNIGKSENCYLGGDAIFDNVELNGQSNGKHGGAINGGFVAQGHILIMGANICNSALANNWELTDSSPLRVLQIFGGTNGTNLTSASIRDNSGNLLPEYEYADYYKSNQSVISAKGDYGNQTVNLATYVIIHSGVYSNVFGGSFSTSNVRSIGDFISATAAQVTDDSVQKYYKRGDYDYISLTQAEAEEKWSSEPAKVFVGDLLSTHLVLRGGIVTDTVCGGSSGAKAYIYGGDRKSVV